MDVEELLAAGIDVYTTLNIQHLESVKDVVAKITHVVVRESVPDSILDRADEVEVVDITPEDLIQRLKEGKVYIPEQAERAIRNYFTEGNLTALRELALRRTAQRVDRADAELHADACHRGTVGNQRSRACLHQRRPGFGGARSLCAASCGPAARALDGALMSKLRRRGSSAKRTATISPNASAWPNALAGRPVTIPAADRADAVVNYAGTNNIHAHRRVAHETAVVVRVVSRLDRQPAHPPRQRHQCACHGRSGRGLPVPASGGSESDAMFRRQAGMIRSQFGGTAAMVAAALAAWTCPSPVSRHFEHCTGVSDGGSGERQ